MAVGFVFERNAAFSVSLQSCEAAQVLQPTA